jgi:thiamine kinase-like enzyme
VAVIHGEYYPSNILFCGSRVLPVDWESAAAVAGEIDLAALTEAWPRKASQECELEYCRARWLDGAPGDFGRRLAAARFYMAFRWLSDDPNWAAQ